MHIILNYTITVYSNALQPIPPGLSFFGFRWKKLKDRTDGALLDWTRQHAPPWDFMYLNCCLASSRKIGCFGTCKAVVWVKWK